MDILSEICKQLIMYKHLYDSIRLIDPIHKKVIQCHNSIEDVSDTCYDLWGKSKFCENCISLKAYDEEDTTFKIECCSNHIVSVIAIPIILNDHKYIVELLKIISQTTIMQEQCANQKQMNRVVDEINKKLVNECKNSIST